MAEFKVSKAPTYGYEFNDENGTNCVLKLTSLATESSIWFGAKEIGLEHFKAGEGWKDVVLPDTMEEHYHANNMMHLTQTQVQALLPYLQKFAETGTL